MILAAEGSGGLVRRQRGAGPTVIDLFSGAGLFSLAFRHEGYRLEAAYEFDRVAAATYRLNFRDRVTVADLGALPPTGRCDVIAAGPPCQGFSSIGERREDDPRNLLCRVVPKWAAHCGAKVAVVENVAGFLQSHAWGLMAADFEKLGYEVKAWTLNARDFGVAQNRIRSFTICSRVGLPDLDVLRHSPARTVREAFADLPRYPAPEIQHFARTQSDYAMDRIRRIPPGGDIRDLVDTAPHLVPPSWYRTRGKVVDIWGRIPWNGVANTVRTGFLNPSRGRFLHPAEDRPITFREAARLQSLPDTFRFVGTPQQIARQIGNGVPFNLGRRVARAVKSLL